jgi:hypothetical protein
VIIRSENKAIVKELKQLEKLIVENGGWFDEQLAIVEKDGALSIEIEGPKNQGEYIIKVPEKLLVNAKDLHIKLEGDQFIIDPDKSVMSDKQIAVSEHMICLYNLTNKAKLHREEFPWIALKGSLELMDLLSHARSSNKALEEKQSFMHDLPGAPSENEFVCSSFVLTRVLGRKESDGAQKVQKIMPFIDYLNHDHKGSQFIFSGQGEAESNLRIQNSQPFMDQLQCYVTYGIYDSLDTFISYGFVDRRAPYVRSVPTVVDTAKFGRLTVNSYPGAKNEKLLSKEIRDLQRFMPVINRDEDGQFMVSHLMIPVLKWPHILRRVLRIIIRTMAGPDASQKDVIQEVYEAEKQILEANILFYQSLIKDLSAAKAGDEAHRALAVDLAQLQLYKLYKYRYDETFFMHLMDNEEPPARVEAAS